MALYGTEKNGDRTVWNSQYSDMLPRFGLNLIVFIVSSGSM